MPHCKHVERKSVCQMHENKNCFFRTVLELFYYIFAHNTVITDLAPQVAEANRGGPGKIKINEIC